MYPSTTRNDSAGRAVDSNDVSRPGAKSTSCAPALTPSDRRSNAYSVSSYSSTEHVAMSPVSPAPRASLSAALRMLHHLPMLPLTTSSALATTARAALALLLHASHSLATAQRTKRLSSATASTLLVAFVKVVGDAGVAAAGFANVRSNADAPARTPSATLSPRVGEAARRVASPFARIGSAGSGGDSEANDDDGGWTTVAVDRNGGTGGRQTSSASDADAANAARMRTFDWTRLLGENDADSLTAAVALVTCELSACTTNDYLGRALHG